MTVTANVDADATNKTLHRWVDDQPRPGRPGQFVLPPDDQGQIRMEIQVPRQPGETGSNLGEEQTNEIESIRMIRSMTTPEDNRRPRIRSATSGTYLGDAMPIDSRKRRLRLCVSTGLFASPAEVTL